MRLPRKLKKKAKKERETAEIMKTIEEMYYKHFIDRLKNLPPATDEQWKEARQKVKTL